MFLLLQVILHPWTLVTKLTVTLYDVEDGSSDSIDSANWRNMIGVDGAVRNRLIIEAVSNFISLEAQSHLSAHNILIIQDSSATKCGVVCSSYEILAGMLVDESRFLQLKNDYVAEVIDRYSTFMLDCPPLSLLDFDTFQCWRQRQFSSTLTHRRNFHFLNAENK